MRRVREQHHGFFRSIALYRRLICAIGACCITHGAAAQDVDLNLNGDTFQIQYINPIKTHISSYNSEVAGSALFNSNDDYLFGVGARLRGQAGTGSPGLEVGIGAKLFGGSVAGKGVGALALDGALRYAPPPLPRFGIRGELYYAPDIVAFIDSSGYFQAEVRLEYEVLPDSYVYVGYRRLHVSIHGGPTETVDSRAHFGIQIHF